MKLHLTQAAGHQLITGYGDGWVEVNTIRHRSSLIITPNQLYPQWQAPGFAALDADSFTLLASLQPEVILLGTGTAHHFVQPGLIRALIQANISIECMNTAAACRTYNILMAEDRHVAAALIIETT